MEDPRAWYEGAEEDVAKPGGEGSPTANPETADTAQAGLDTAAAASRAPGPCPLPPQNGQEAEAAVARWTDMIRSSPESAVEAVAEVRCAEPIRP